MNPESRPRLLNLQQLAMVSIGQRVWQTALIKSYIKQLFSRKNETELETTRFLDWIVTCRSIYDKLKEERLPPRLTSELCYVVKQMGDHMYDWYHYVERTNKFLADKCGQQLAHPERIHWTASGSIDVERVIVDNWIENVSQANACAVYFVSILHGLGKRWRDEVWNGMSAKLKITCRRILSCRESYASAFLYACIGDPRESLEIAKKLGYSTIEPRQRFLLFVAKGYLELATSVWHQLNDATRHSVIDKAFRLALRRSSTFCHRRFEKRRYDEIALFLYCRMNQQHRFSILCDLSSNYYVTKLLYMAASRPHLDLLMPLLDQVLEYILEEVDNVYSDLVSWLIYDMLEDFDCAYVPRGTLVKVWKRLPIAIKRDIHFDEILEGLFEEWDLISLRILVNVPELASEQERFVDGLVGCYVKSMAKVGHDRLEELAERVFVRDSDVQRFKRGVRDCREVDRSENVG